MKPVRGEKLPFESISRSQTCRGVRSQEGQSRDCDLISAERLLETVRSINLPPCGGFKWLVTRVLSMFAKGEFAGGRGSGRAGRRGVRRLSGSFALPVTGLFDK